MSSLTSKKWIIIGLSGVSICGYIFYRVFLKFKKTEIKSQPNQVGIEEKENEKNKEIEKADCTQLSNKGKNHTTIKTPLEITANISLDINKKIELSITKQANLLFPSKIIKKNEIIREIVHEGAIEEENLNKLNKQRRQSTITYARKYRDDDEDLPYSHAQITMKQKSSLKSPKKEKLDFKFQRTGIHLKDKNSNEMNPLPNGNNTIINIVNDLRLVENINNKVKQYAKDNNLENQESIYLPMLTNEIDEEFQMENDDGYLEEDDEDLKEIEIPFLTKLTNENEQDIHDENEFNVGRDFSDIVGKHISNRKLTSEQLDFISNPDEMNEILFNKNSDAFYKNNYNIKTEIKIMEGSSKIEVIMGDLLLIILKYLYSELNTVLIEMSDNFVEQRRYYLESDHSTYISIINLFLRKKEEFFLGVLSEIMSRLNITQNLLDNTFVYYMNYADRNDQLILNIQSAYSKVYKAGIKKTIAPKKLTKEKLKIILEFECAQYEELLRTYNYKLDVIQIMVVDYTYLEFGLDKEAIRAAMNKHNVYEDEEFEIYLSKLEEFEKSAFLNI